MTTKQNHSPIYQAFGLNIQCELPTAALFGMTPIHDVAPDAVIQIAPVPLELENASYQAPFISYAPGNLLFNVGGVARYLISEGRSITVDIAPGAQDGDVATYTFGSALGSLLYQRGILALHGSAVKTSKGAVIFTGQKGAGKSTLATALSERGWEFMSDDVCAVHFDKGLPVLYPGLSRAKLTAVSYSSVLGRPPEGQPISPIMGKYGVTFNINREPAPFYALCTLETTPGDPYIEPIIGGAKRLEAMHAGVYRQFLHQLIETPAQRFTQYTTATAQTVSLRACRSLNFNKMAEFIQLLEREVLT